MATADNVRLVLELYGVDKASAPINDVVSSMGKLAAGVGAVAIAAKQIYDFARAGAELEFTSTRFDRLAESVGTTSNVLMNDLREATRGIYSDAELMASASDLMALGLAKTHDEAVRLAAVSAGLNMNMNQLVLTLTNQTTMRFDALGVSTDGFKEKLKELEAQGYSTNDAFKEAFLQQAEDQLEKVGHAADTSLGSFMKFEAAMEDAKNQAKDTAQNGLAPLIDYLAESTIKMNDNQRILKELNEELYKEYSAHKVLTPEMEALIAQYERGVAMTEYYAENTTTLAGAIEMTAEEVETMTKLNEEYLSTIGDVTSEINDFAEKQSELKEKHADLLEEKQKLINEGYTVESEKIQEINDKLAENEEKQSDNAAAMEEATHRRILAMLEEQLSVDGLDARESEFLLQQGIKWGIYSEDAVEEMRYVQKQVELLKEDYASIPSLVETTFRATFETAGYEGYGSGFSYATGDTQYQRSHHASGGSFMIPTSYGNEGFLLGNGDTASGGEKLKIIPKNGTGNEDIIAAIQSNRIDYDAFARAVVAAVQQGAK